MKKLATHPLITNAKTDATMTITDNEFKTGVFQAFMDKAFLLGFGVQHNSEYYLIQGKIIKVKYIQTEE